MSIAARIALTLVLLAVGSFAGFGFVASLEPGGWRVYRLLYAIVAALCASGEPLLAAHAMIAAWPKGGAPWPNRCKRERAASRTGGDVPLDDDAGSAAARRDDRGDGLRGGTDVAVMEAFADGELRRILRPGDIVVMDNLSAHKHPAVVAAIESDGAIACVLPPYSPDFNPIESMRSKVEEILRSLKARTAEALLDAIGVALRSVTMADAEGWFAHCGYGVSVALRLQAATGQAELQCWAQERCGVAELHQA